jgi:hypothetical protein
MKNGFGAIYLLFIRFGAKFDACDKFFWINKLGRRIEPKNYWSSTQIHPKISEQMTQPTLEIQKYLRANTLEQLEKDFGIYHRRHNKYPNLVLLKYDQISSPFKEKIVQECRGIILDTDNNLNVVSRPYDKFFNYGEGLAAKIDWNTAKVVEKLDGSITTLYHYDGHWEVASNGMPDAAGNVNGYDKSFADLFWEVFNASGYKLPTDTNTCYCFELMTRYNRVVVKHEKSRLFLHGARSLSDFEEKNPIPVAHENGWECVKFFPLQTIEEVQEAAEKLDPMVGEGFIVVDQNFNRLKVKSSQYVAMSHLRESVGSSKRQLLEIVRKNEGSEFLQHFEEFKDDYYELKAKFEHLMGRMEGFYEATKNIQEKKDFALIAKNQPFSGALFAVRWGSSPSFRKYVSEMNIKSLEQLLGLKADVGSGSKI